jgi:Protein of unknown function (DUF2800)
VYKRIVEEQGEAAAWGNYVHQQIEQHYKTLEPPPENVYQYWPHVEAAIAWAGGVGYRPATAEKHSKICYFEHQMALSSKLKRTEWTAPDVWARAIADVLIIDGTVAYVIDWKTGKVKPDNKQLKLFALFVFYHFPWVTECHTSFEWLQHNQNTRDWFSVIDVPELWPDFIPDLRAFKDAFKTETWQERPSGLCNGWCPVDTCKFWKPKK